MTKKYLRPRVSNTRPVGLMWPTRCICAASEHRNKIIVFEVETDNACKILFDIFSNLNQMKAIYAEVVTPVAVSLEAGGLPGYPESEINVSKTRQSFVALYFQKY
jgi:hypothetical protein